MTLQADMMSALLTRVASLSLTPATVKVVQPLRKPPTISGPYVWTTLLPNEPITRGVNTGGQHRGFLQLMVSWPMGKDEGIIPANDIAGQIMDHFAKGTIMDFGTARVKVIRKPWTAPAIQDATRFELPVNVPYICDINT